MGMKNKHCRARFFARRRARIARYKKWRAARRKHMRNKKWRRRYYRRHSYRRARLMKLRWKKLIACLKNKKCKAKMMARRAALRKKMKNKAWRRAYFLKELRLRRRHRAVRRYRRYLHRRYRARLYRVRPKRRI